MSKSFALQEGDLVLGAGRSFQTVSGKDKLAQDLRLWILEKLGIDPSTPTIGNTLDGGFSNGQYIEGMVGQIADQVSASQIQSTIGSYLQLYQALQQQKIKQESLAYDGKTTVEAGEVLASVDSIDIIRTDPTTLVIRVAVTTIDHNTLKLTFPVSQ